MGWLRKIFKGSSHKISRGQDHGESRDDMSGNETSNSVDTDTQSEDENEDTDLAIALSLVEEEQEKYKSIENASDVEEDEQLARALQESLNVESPPPEDDDLYQPSPVVSSSRFRRCAGCNNEIDHGGFLSCMGAVWHPECFRCHACNQAISEDGFSMDECHPYHMYCFKELHHPKCVVCKQFIPTNMDGLIEYRAHPFWLENYCPSHEFDGTPSCCSCERMEPRDTQYITLDDGRKLCLECLDSAIMDTSECQPLYLDIQEFYEGLDMKVEQEIPLLLVERQALNEAMEGETNGRRPLSEIRGLCLSEERTVSTIQERPRIGAGNRLDITTEPFPLTQQCDVAAILILHGLPRYLTGTILAHELMHAWLRLKGYGPFGPEVEEGICQVLAYMWLDSEIISESGSNVASTSPSSSSAPSIMGARSQFERKLGEFFKHQIEIDSSSVYGNGFRAGHQSVLKYGLRHTLHHIQRTGSFPI